MRGITSLLVKYHGRVVGTLAETKTGKCAFQYDREWLADGFSISLFSLLLRDEVFLPSKDVFDGLFGVFADSLPDGWGRLLADRVLLSRGISPDTVSPIVRLSIVGRTGMGALEYFPELDQVSSEVHRSFDEMAAECEKILREQESDDLDLLFSLGGSSGGARPKVLLAIDGESWIVKFPSSYDRKSIGREEYEYMKCASLCGIDVPKVRLFPSKQGEGYFGVKRFDRVKSTENDENGDAEEGCIEKKHMVTVSGLLETSHRTPNLDYNDLMKLTCILAADSRQVEEMYRRMCFNVFAHNRDDHSKNFTYVYCEKEKRWKLSPAYDLTYSNSIGGWHATCVNGNGLDPGMKDLLAVGEKVGLGEAKAKRIASEIQEIVEERLGEILSSYKKS